jgi:AraC-like DNA-binding protein
MAAAVPAFVVAQSRGITHDLWRREAWAQLVLVTEGAITISTQAGSYLAPHGHAVFVPANLAHGIASRRSAELLRLFAKPALIRNPARPTVLESSRLVEELLIAVMEAGPAHAAGGAETRLAQVLADRIALLKTREFFLPAVTSVHFAPIVQKLMKNPARDVTLESWCAETGMSLKTAARRFEAEAGMTYRRWWLRLRMLHALERLADGESITLVAHELGHPSLAAFSVAFRRALGEPPMRYAIRLPR